MQTRSSRRRRPSSRSTRAAKSRPSTTTHARRRRSACPGRSSAATTRRTSTSAGCSKGSTIASSSSSRRAISSSSTTCASCTDARATPRRAASVTCRAATRIATACAAAWRCCRDARADRRDLSGLPRVRLGRISRRAGLADGAHAPVGVRRRAGRCAATAGRCSAPARLRPLHPRSSRGLGRPRGRHAARGGRARISRRAFRARGRGADPPARRCEALSLCDRPVVPGRALARVGPQPRVAGRTVFAGGGRELRGVAACRRRGPPAALRRHRQGGRARDARPRALPPRAASGDPDVALPAEALVLAFTAAVIHAVWNLLLAGARDSQAFAAVVLLVGAVVGAPACVFFWELHADVWPYLAATSALELAYFVLLAFAYNRAELSVVYPLARGLAPVLVLAGAVAFTGADTTAQQVLGVLLVACGILLVRGVRRGRGVVFGIAIAACIASYTVVDKHGVAHASPVAY